MKQEKSKNIDQKSEELKKNLLFILRKHPEGLTISDLSKLTGAHRQTVTKYVLVLEALGEIYRRRVGSATLHYLKSSYPGQKEGRR